ncbi:MAG TPA: BrnT family toxin [Acidobacteriaceae bacterium]|nr:BrnT family toxin [Acidobacteriaceae bacterium]
MPLLFEWDPRKERANRRKHRVSFEEASTIFGDTLSITISDEEHSSEEERWITVGRSNRGNLLVVVHTESRAAIRIISGRRATRGERNQYEEGA